MARRNKNFSGVKLANAVKILKAFSTGTVSGNNIVLNDKYQVDASNNQVTLTLQFKNIGVAASTDVFLDNAQLANAVKDSLIDFKVGADTAIDNKLLKISSTAITTNLTPLPDDLKIDFIIKGGVKDVAYTVPDFKLNAVGDTVNLDFSIFFFHL